MLRNRIPVALSASLEAHLRSYTASACTALLARVAPVGVIGAIALASAETALADSIVYTPAATPLVLSPVLQGTFSIWAGALSIQLNHGGAPNLILQETEWFYLDGSKANLNASGSAVRGAHGVKALASGAPIGGGQSFGRSALMEAALFDRYFCVTGGFGSCPKHTLASGSWAKSPYYQGQTTGYIGVRFDLSDGVHYGWAEVTVSGFQSRMSTTLDGYAYDAVPGQQILAGQTTNSANPTPEPGTLGLLALGSLGLGFWRRRKTLGSQQ